MCLHVLSEEICEVARAWTARLGLGDRRGGTVTEAMMSDSH